MTAIGLVCTAVIMLTIAAFAIVPMVYRRGVEVAGTGLRVVNCPYALEEVSRLLADFEARWSMAFGSQQTREVMRAIDAVTATFVSGAIDYHGMLIGGGITDTPREVRIVRKSGSVRRSALAHELAHVALWHLHGTPEPGHTGNWTKQHDDIVNALR